MTKYLLIALLATSLALIVSVRSCERVMEDRDRLSDNQRSLMSKAEFYRTSDSLNAASVERLTLTHRELSKYNEELTKKVKILNVRIKDLKTISVTGSTTQYNIETQIRDSIVVRDSMIIDTLKCFDFHTPWLDFEGCTNKGRLTAHIESRDTLSTVVHRVRRQFLFFRWGCKAIRQEVVSSNPNSRIVYTEYIELK